MGWKVNKSSFWTRGEYLTKCLLPLHLFLPLYQNIYIFFEIRSSLILQKILWQKFCKPSIDIWDFIEENRILCFFEMSTLCAGLITMSQNRTKRCRTWLSDVWRLHILDVVAFTLGIVCLALSSWPAESS